VRRLAAVACAVPAASALTLVAQSSAPEPFVTLRQAIGDAGSPGRQISISSNGRFIAFVSRAPLVAETRRYPNIYVLDRDTGLVTLETAAPDGCRLGDACASPHLSGDGRWLTYETSDYDAAAGSPPRSVVVLKDRRTGAARRIGAPGVAANGSLRDPSVSADGRSVVFAASATNLVTGADANGVSEDIYTFDVASSRLQRISVDSAGRQAPAGASFAPAISGDGRYIVFSSTASLDGASPRPGGRPRVDVFVRDTQLHTTKRISVRTDGSPANGSSYGAAISDDGRFVAFVSEATDLVKGDTNHATDIYLYEARTGAISLVSRSDAGRAANGASTQPAVSADGGVIVFQSDASDLACGGQCPAAGRDINLVADVFAADRHSGAVRRISTGRNPWMEPSVWPAIDGAAATVAFSSRHPCYAEDDGDDFDLFIGGMNKGINTASKGRSP
jgi:Tol biopolymer transport system component